MPNREAKLSILSFSSRSRAGANGISAMRRLEVIVVVKTAATATAYAIQTEVAEVVV